MCGLIGVFSKRGKRAGQYAFELFKKQEKRGSKGFGYLAIHQGKIVSIQRAKDADTIRKHLMTETAETILFHHRFPTSTENSVGTTHPMFVSHDELEYDYYLAHNGVITNAAGMKDKHEDLEYEYNTKHCVYEVAEFKDTTRSERISSVKVKFNDSECLAIEFARYIEGLSDSIKAIGQAAFWAVAVEKGTNNVANVFYGRNHGRELCELDTKKWLVISSETGTIIDPMKLFSINITDLTQYVQDLDIDEAKPVEVKHMGYRNWNTNNYLPEPTAYGVKQALENKKYTFAEVKKTNHLLTDFTAVWTENVLLYVPNQYVPKSKVENVYDHQRSLDWDDKKEEPNQKELDRLDELAEEYTKAQSRADIIEEKIESGEIEETEFAGMLNRYQADASMAYDLLFALGLPDSQVNEAINEAMELEEYSKQYEAEKIIEA